MDLFEALQGSPVAVDIVVEHLDAMLKHQVSWEEICKGLGARLLELLKREVGKVAVIHRLFTEALLQMDEWAPWIPKEALEVPNRDGDPPVHALMKTCGMELTYAFLDLNPYWEEAATLLNRDDKTLYELEGGELLREKLFAKTLDEVFG